MALEQDVQALIAVVKALEARLLALENMIGGATKVLGSGGNSIVIGPQGIEMTAGSSLRVNVGSDYLLNVQGTALINAQGDYQVTVGRNATMTVGANETITVGGSATEQVGGQASVTIGGNAQTTVGGTHQTTVGMDTIIVAAKDVQIKAHRHLKADVGQNLEMTVQKLAAIQPGDNLVLKTGAASAELKKDGTVTIKGKDISLEASGKLSGKASSDLILKGSKILQN